MQIKCSNFKQKTNGVKWFNKLKLFAFLYFFSPFKNEEQTKAATLMSRRIGQSIGIVRPHHCQLHISAIAHNLHWIIWKYFAFCVRVLDSTEPAERNHWLSAMNFDVFGAIWIMATYFIRFSEFKLRISCYKPDATARFEHNAERDQRVSGVDPMPKKKKVNLAKEAHVKNSLLFELWLDLNFP